MTLEERVKESLGEEGYTNVYTQEDEPHKEYAEHKHQKETAHIVIKGSMEITMDDKVYTLQKGDRCDVQKDTIHSANIGPQGCTYAIGEK